MEATSDRRPSLLEQCRQAARGSIASGARAGLRASVGLLTAEQHGDVATESISEPPLSPDSRRASSTGLLHSFSARAGSDAISPKTNPRRQFPAEKLQGHFINPFADPRPSSGPSAWRGRVDHLRDPFSDAHALDEKSRGLSGRPQSPGTAPQPPFHIFTTQRKWFVVVIIGMAGLFSGLSSNIYFPSLDMIAKDLNVSADAVSLTITSYLIIQGISPIFWGSFSDALGRRPIYIASFTVYIAANIALSWSPNFAVLLIFRGIQAAGSASTVSIGNGVIQDMSPPSERGAFISFYQAIRNFSIAIGPVLGGLLANSFGFRSVFVFLLILSSIVILVIIVLLPETMRTIAGDGTVRLEGIYQPLAYRLGKQPWYAVNPRPIDGSERKKITSKTFVDPVKLLLEKDILLTLLFGGVVYTIWSMMTSSTTVLFKEKFGLDELQVGLAYLPNGFGTIVGSAIAGKLMTKHYQEAEKAYKTRHAIPETQSLPVKMLPSDFPIESARLRSLPWISLVFAASVGIYGFTLAFDSLVALKGWIFVPLTVQFFIAATSNAVFAMNQTLVSDLCPGKGASSTAINNLVRCGLAAVGVSFMERMITALGPAAAFLGLASVIIACAPLPIAHSVWGPGWREARMRKAEEDMLKESNKAPCV